MDPNAILTVLRAWAADLDRVGEVTDSDAAEHFKNLDEWLSKGGFLPDDWKWHMGVKGVSNQRTR